MYDDFVADTSSDAMDPADHAGTGTMANRSIGMQSTPTKALVIVWFLALGAYWLLGYLMRGDRS